MLLSEKLSQMSEDLQNAKLEEERLAKEQEQIENDAKEKELNEKREAELVPIRERILELEGLKNKLELILNTINLNPEEGDGFVMKNYPEKVFADKSESVEYLNKLITNNPEVLEPLGIDSIDKLVESPIGKDSPEVLDYHAADRARNELIDTDNALYDKLIELDVIDESDKDIKSTNGFAQYSKISEKIESKLEDIEEEILLEKIKTPEGGEAREELLNIISKEIEKDIPNLVFSTNKNKDGFEELLLNNNNGRILIKDDSIKFNGWIGSEIVPHMISAYEVKYGKDLAKEALEKAYENKLDLAFVKLDKATGNNSEELQKSLERSNKEKWIEAKESYDGYNEQANKLKHILNSKAEELGKHNIDFNPKYIVGYGGSYDELLVLTEYDSDNKKIKEAFHFGDSIYPPLLNFDSLKDFILKRREQLEELITIIEKVESEEDISKLVRGNNNPISEIHRKILGTRFDEVRRRNNLESEKLSAFRSYEEAHSYFDKNNKERQNKSEKVGELIKTAIESSEKKKELERELKAENWNNDVSRIDTEVSRIEKTRNDAVEVMAQIMRFEMDIPDEELILDGNYITVISVKEEIKSVEDELKLKRDKVYDLRNKRSVKLNNKPKVFGIKTWTDEVESMKQEIESLDNEIKNLSNIKLSELSSKMYFQIRTPEYTEVNKLIKSQERIKGTKSQILALLSTKVTDLINRKVPKDILRLNSKFKELQEKLY